MTWRCVRCGDLVYHEDRRHRCQPPSLVLSPNEPTAFGCGILVGGLLTLTLFAVFDWLI